MCILSGRTPSTTAPLASPCPAQALGPAQRQQLAVAALAGTQPIRHLATDHDVSRKFVYQQADKAQRALDHAFAPPPAPDPVLFHLPVTKAWRQRLTLGLRLTCPRRCPAAH